MASLKNSRAVFGITSPRSITKIIPEIRLLIDNFDGLPWNTDNQKKFYNLLYEQDDFEGSIRANDEAFAARDRVNRAPKALGFVDLTPKIELTAAGHDLLSGVRVHEVILKQLLKFQLPSPYHTDTSRRFNIRPYLELLRLIYTLNGLTKVEIALFFTQMTRYRHFERISMKIKRFRLLSFDNTKASKIQFNSLITRELAAVYIDEIKQNKIKIRESKTKASLTSFIATKWRNCKDYADAFQRYLVATNLTSYDAITNRIVVNEFHRPDVEFLLKSIEQNALGFANCIDFKHYLFANDNIKLYSDDPKRSIDKIKDYVDPTSLTHKNADDLKSYIEQVEERIREENRKSLIASLKGYDSYQEVVSKYNDIIKRNVPDPPLYFEWNTWRVFVMMNYAEDIVGHFKTDTNGNPMSIASGNVPDLVIHYDSFVLVVEVTISQGYTQYNMEGEPVTRHYGDVKKATTKPVYCLFIAPKINENVIGHFYLANRHNVKAHGGKTSIIPIDLDTFLKLSKNAKDRAFNDPRDLEDLLESIIEYLYTCNDEIEWNNHILNSVDNWLSCI